MESRFVEAVLGIQNGKYKSLYEIVKELRFFKDIITQYIKGDSLYSEVYQLQ